MAQDLSKYRRKLEALNKPRSGGGDKSYIDLEQGKNVVRLLPGHPNMDSFYTEVFYHKRQVGGKNVSVVCANNGDEQAGNCAICESIAKMRTHKDKKQRDLFYSWRAKPRYFANALNRADDPQTVKVLGFGVTILKELLQLIVDPEEFGDILDPKEGVDIIIKKTGEKLDTEYTVTPRRNSTPIFDDPKAIRKLIGKTEDDTQLQDLTSMQETSLTEEQQMTLWDGESLKTDDDDDEEETPKKGKKTSKKPAPDEDEDDEEETPKPKKGKKAPPVDDDEDDEEEAPKPKKAKKPPVDDDDDDEEETPKPKKSKKPAPAEDDDEEEEDLNAVLARHKKGGKK